MATNKRGSRKAAKASSKKATRTGPGKAKATRAYAASAAISTRKVKPVEAQEIKVRYVERAYKFSEARRKDEIHPRKVIPKAPVGHKVLDMLPTAPLAFEETVPLAALEAARAVSRAPADTITLVKNVQLNDVATEDTASHVCDQAWLSNVM